ncbi:MAG: uridine kinase [Halobacteriovoraceae bacterium]|nr:uridine kinase [Halobacteriovoraceae bacterium]
MDTVIERSIIIAVAGGSGSGKTTFANKLLNSIGSDNCTVISQDNYYFDQSHLFDVDGGSVNFDHPNSLDFNLMASQLHSLGRGIEIDYPQYCFKTHSRLENPLKIGPKKFMILDGILILHSEIVRKSIDFAFFLEVPEEHRFERRVNRDVLERGRTREGSLQQIQTHVKPMHDKFVGPSKQWAHEVLLHPTLECLDRFAENWKETISKVVSL